MSKQVVDIEQSFSHSLDTLNPESIGLDDIVLLWSSDVREMAHLPSRRWRFIKFILIHNLLLKFLFLSPQLIEFITVCARETERSMVASKCISTQEVMQITGE